MGLMSSKIGREKLRPGDHIYTWRNGYSYSHHGIYVGDGKVIHVTRGPGLIIFSTYRSQPSGDRVVCCSIEDFLCDGELYRFEYGVSKFMFLIKRAGTCSFASSKPPEDVLHRASYLLEYGFGDYHLFDKNCEDFALYCKTSILKDHKSPSGTSGQSGQIISILAAFSAVTLIPYHFLPSCFVVLALVVFGYYCFFRLYLDVGSRSDNVVAVEKLDNVQQDVAVEKLDNVQQDEMMEKSTRWFLGAGHYFSYTIFAINNWYWTPESTILIWLKSVFRYGILYCVVTEHLRLHGFKLGEYSAYTIWLLGYFYWRWTSVSTILRWTRLLVFSAFVACLVSHQRDHPRRLKLDTYTDGTMLVLELWYWTPGITILQFIKLAFLHSYLFNIVSSRLRSHRRMCCWAFSASFVIQSAALLLGLDYSDYSFRVKKIITFL